MLFRICFIVIGYFFGLIQTAFIYGKLHGIDIREHGSGNAGTTNTLRVLGTKAGLVVFFGDSFKCILAILVTVALFQSKCDIHKLLIGAYTATGVIFGHNFPFYMNFKGGKGIAATAGLIISFWILTGNIWFFIIGNLAFFGVFFITHYVSLGSLVLYITFFVMCLVMGTMGLFEGISSVQLTEMYIVIIVLLVMAFWRHRSNIKKLIKGEERKTYLLKKNKAN
ncbi:MAG: glycerol-3-phosphate 1-O-acyltransferase PlsY [Lachnospiraceae bacterium]|nr:glycerol-3-phosphate 1-O-acyltransferase PlsY [Lachnospiraceae bacterium]